MSTKAQAILDEIRALPPAEIQEVWREIQGRVEAAPPSAPVELHGEPLTDQDLEQIARVTFQMLDEEERRAETQ